MKVIRKKTILPFFYEEGYYDKKMQSIKIFYCSNEPNITTFPTKEDQKNMQNEYSKFYASSPLEEIILDQLSYIELIFKHNKFWRIVHKK